ncbi:H(+)/Cl(-) exchange transporter ClcA [Floridanema evergladense]|uniref:H(+)/Cl(-) exchange transporter ClcA n=1 Tax=Floridaenema evergladense BLCC-F167 TaxID=3153639 RepID=A0ABV4WUQ8_9CYAN
MESKPNNQNINPLNSILQSRRFKETIGKLNPVLFWAAIAGFLTGVIGGSFRFLISAILNSRVHWIDSLDKILGAIISIALSGIMAYLGFWIMRRFSPDTSGSGIPQIEGMLSRHFPLVWQRVLPVKFTTGILILGSGMVMGREGPTIQMGGSIGKMVATWFRANHEQTRVLVAACGGAGLATAFNAPLAGIMFVFEELKPVFEDEVHAYRAVTLSCISATVGLQLILGTGPVLKLTQFETPPLASLWIFALLGVAFGIIGYYFNFFLVKSLNFFSSLRGIYYHLTGLFVGSFIGLMSWFYTPTTGGGEEMIIWSFNNVEPSHILLLLFAVRFGMTILCYGSGAPGGIFAPMLSIATLFCLGIAKQTHIWFPTILPYPEVLTIAGMGALVAATVRAPLTAILLTLEITANYLLILPILVSCFTASMTAHGMGGRPIYTVLLERKLQK